MRPNTNLRPSFQNHRTLPQSRKKQFDSPDSSGQTSHRLERAWPRSPTPALVIPYPPKFIIRFYCSGQASPCPDNLNPVRNCVRANADNSRYFNSNRSGRRNPVQPVQKGLRRISAIWLEGQPPQKCQNIQVALRCNKKLQPQHFQANCFAELRQEIRRDRRSDLRKD